MDSLLQSKKQASFFTRWVSLTLLAILSAAISLLVAQINGGVFLLGGAVGVATGILAIWFNRPPIGNYTMSFYGTLFLLIILPYNQFILRVVNILRGVPIENVLGQRSLITVWKEVATIVLLGICVLQILISKKGRFPKWNGFEKLLILFTVFGICYIPVSGNLVAGIYGFNYAFRYILAYFLFRYMCPDVKQVRIIISVMVFNALLSAIFGLVQVFVMGKSFFAMFLPPDSLGNVIETFGGNIRMMSFLSSPNDFGLFMFIHIAIVFSLLVFGVKDYKKLKSWLFLFLMMLGLLLSYSRSTLLGLIAGGTVFLMKWKSHLVFRVIVGGLGALFVLSILLLAGYTPKPTSNPLLTAFNRFLAAFQLEDSSSQFHAAAVKDALSSITNHPFGLGLGTADHIGRRFFPTTYVWGESWWLQRGAEMGIWVYPIVILILLAALSRGIKQFNSINDRFLKAVTLSSMVVLVGVYIAGITFTAWSDFGIMFYVWGLLGLGLNVTNIEKASKLYP